MALIKCPDCGREVSDRATGCPHCARPLRPRPTFFPSTSGQLIGFLMAIGLFVLVGFAVVGQYRYETCIERKCSVIPGWPEMTEFKRACVERCAKR